MAPYVIADSDDDEDTPYSPPPPGTSPRTVNEVESPVGHAHHTESTDPSFFQSILEEQLDATRRHRQEGGRPSSPMSTDPLQAAEVDHAGAEAPGRDLGRDSGRRDDPWEIPSSPEPLAVTRPATQGQRRQRATAEKSRRSPSPALHTEHSGHDTDDRNGHGSNKRRRVVPAEESSQNVDQVEIVRHRSQGSSNMPPPTLPIDRSSFVVAPRPLTDSQREQYRSFGQDSGDEEPSQDQGPSLPPAGGIAFSRSSGSATNMNTPRSEMVSSRDWDPRLEPPGRDEPPGRKSRIPSGQWDSSPDEISGDGPVPLAAPTRRQRLKDSLILGHPETGASDEPDAPQRPAKLQEGYSGRVGDAGATGQRDDMEERRGKADENHTDSLPETAPGASARSVTKSKKKRGRPRKSAPDEDTPHEPGCEKDGNGKDAPRGITGANITRSEGNRGGGQGSSNGGGGRHVDVQPVGDKDTGLSPGETRCPTALGEAAQGGADMVGHATGRDVDDGCCSAPQVTRELSKSPTGAADKTGAGDAAERERVPLSKGTGLAAGSPSPSPLAGNRPLYRVGLSKKSRIAPLLKTMRRG